MDRLLKLAVVCLGVFAAPLAQANETALDWSGTYVGAGLSAVEVDTQMYSVPQKTYAGYNIKNFGGNHLYGFLHTGADWQFGKTVLGVRLQNQRTASSGDEMWKLDELLATKVKNLTILSARAGYLVRPELLVYGHLGAAYGKFDYASIDKRWNQVDDQMKASRRGVSLGLGTEYRLSDRFSLFAEYTHINFRNEESTFDYGVSGGAIDWTYDFKHHMNLLQLGFNMRY